MMGLTLAASFDLDTNGSLVVEKDLLDLGISSDLEVSWADQTGANIALLVEALGS